MASWDRAVDHALGIPQQRAESARQQQEEAAAIEKERTMQAATDLISDLRHDGKLIDNLLALPDGDLFSVLQTIWHADYEGSKLLEIFDPTEWRGQSRADLERVEQKLLAGDPAPELVRTAILRCAIATTSFQERLAHEDGRGEGLER